MMKNSSVDFMDKYLLAGVFLFGLQIAGFAQAGTLDPTFGTGGIVTTNFGLREDFGGQVLLQPDGKIVVVGWSYDGVTEDFALARYLSDGNLDETFGNGGKVITDFEAKDNVAARGALQKDGKILLVGTYRTGPVGAADKGMLVRYLPDGNLDASFGIGGIVSTSFDQVSIACEAVAVQTDGKIVVVGTYDNAEGAFMTIRYLPDGTLDDSFGINGFVITQIPAYSIIHAYDLAIRPGGEIIVFGGILAPIHDLLTLQYLSNGMLDVTFGDGGIIRTDFDGQEDFAHSLALQQDGKIILGGESGTSFGSNFVAARYHVDGTLDSTFGSAGKLSTQFLQHSSGQSLAIQSDGKIVFAGYTTDSFSNFVFAVARYLGDGSLDTSFGNGGKTTIGFGDHDFSFGYSVSIQADGKILVSGDSRSDSTFTDFALIRLISEVDVATFLPAESKQNFSLFPNPATGTISVQWIQNQFASVQVKLIDGSGKQVMAWNKEGISGKESIWELPVSSIPAGVYYLVLLTDGKVLETQKVAFK